MLIIRWLSARYLPAALRAAAGCGRLIARPRLGSFAVGSTGPHPSGPAENNPAAGRGERADRLFRPFVYIAPLVRCPHFFFSN